MNKLWQEYGGTLEAQYACCLVFFENPKSAIH